MYIEFRLPNVGGFDTRLALVHIDIDIDDWVRKYDIQYHKTKIHKYTYRLVLKDDEAYFHFSLTWDPKYAASKQFEFKNPK